MGGYILHVGHNGAVIGTSWSHSEEWLVTSSADRTAGVWSVHSRDSPALLLDRKLHNFRDSHDKVSDPHP